MYVSRTTMPAHALLVTMGQVGFISMALIFKFIYALDIDEDLEALEALDRELEVALARV